MLKTTGKVLIGVLMKRRRDGDAQMDSYRRKRVGRQYDGEGMAIPPPILSGIHHRRLYRHPPHFL